MNVLIRVLCGALVMYLIAPSAARAADKADDAKADDKAACLAREAAKGHDAAASALICHLRSVFQSRIRYKPDAEPVEMTVGSPPMISDDTDTPGPGNVELNVVFNGAWSRDEHALEAPLLDVNYGIGERLQLKYEVPYAIERRTERDASGAEVVTRAHGIGDSNLGLKYRFYDDSDNGLSLGVYPQARFRTPGALCLRAIPRSRCRCCSPKNFRTRRSPPISASSTRMHTATITQASVSVRASTIIWPRCLNSWAMACVRPIRGAALPTSVCVTSSATSRPCSHRSDAISTHRTAVRARAM